MTNKTKNVRAGSSMISAMRKIAGGTSSMGYGASRLGTHRSGTSTGIDNEDLKLLIEKKLNVAQVIYDRKIRDMKPFVLDEACTFIKQ